MNTATKIFLVLLRLAIGWHFLVEGFEKLESVYIGQTLSNRPFTSAGYLSQASGPFAGIFRRQMGDPDKAALERLTVKPLESGQDPALTPGHKRFPPALAADWNDYFGRFEAYYALSPHDADVVKGILEQREDKAVQWLLTGTKEVKKTFASGTVDRTETTGQRIEDYRKKLAEVRELEDEKLPAFGHDVERERLVAAKAEAGRMRAELLADLDHETAAMQAALYSYLTPEQQNKKGTMPQPAVESHWLAWDSSDWVQWFAWWFASLVGAGLLASGLAQLLSHWGQRGQSAGLAWAVCLGLTIVGAVLLVGSLANIGVAWRDYTRAEWMDWLASWGLTMIAAGLLLGFMTRTSCVAGALFLALLYVAMPPWPWLPDQLRTEGHYLFVNKNLIEMLALLTLATTWSGRWVGLDGLIQFLNPWRWRSPEPAPEN
ncbi:MAG TPA: DoxX family protein [Gemmataceae bacterium]|jgi:uncharacterized membrane protein YphA (DoxX/SURF4 family)|nr:DoxX family protein [Gemmataceae bacterium]